MIKLNVAESQIYNLPPTTIQVIKPKMYISGDIELKYNSKLPYGQLNHNTAAIIVWWIKYTFFIRIHE